MGKGKGYGKTILFGEHFVVYGLPGIASGIDKYAQIDIEKIDDENEIIVEDNVFFNETVKKSENPDHIKFKLFEPIYKEKEITGGFKMIYSGTSEPQGGMGLSASLAVAGVRALNEFYNWNLTDEGVNELAYECEKVSHGTPSGIDNSCATYGSLIWFEKNMEGGKNKIETFKAGKPLLLVLGNSGKVGNTKELVAGVRERKESDPEKYDRIFQRAKTLVEEAKIELVLGNQEKIGKLMDENQELLREIGVSCDELDELVSISKKNGALGTKITGAGGGGLMFALVDSVEKQDEIAKAFEEKGYKAIKTIIR